MNQHVFFSQDRSADPIFTYRSRPIACFGMADTLAEARADFHEALALALDDDEPVPTVIEHLERPHPDGFWVRIRLDAGARDRDYAARVLANAWRGGSAPTENLTAILDRSRTDIGEPVVIVCLPEDSIRSVVDEFGHGESCAVAISSANLIEAMTRPGSRASRSEIAEQWTIPCPHSKIRD
ncbi:type II toxin-antitoxin system HicB family antitoxin [Nocardia asteroides]|uniref:type II toxin-antitoxin system HicB family antitoxin n=1 Tax=Nocardia asteroides TaxID=1824 RepID=UPI001E4BFD89|nr:type II toxin-antitoxin system HicB family antitoxin [Nocardia asteroides]UGT61627.1 type II toxin-antitoxin system HicB family antitoxin [Nocardia asteroides]